MDIKVYRLVRDRAQGDEPIGHVADAVVFPDGLSILHWRTSPASTEMYATEAALRQTREASGRSHLAPSGGRGERAVSFAHRAWFCLAFMALMILADKL